MTDALFNLDGSITAAAAGITATCPVTDDGPRGRCLLNNPDYDFLGCRGGVVERIDEPVPHLHVHVFRYDADSCRDWHAIMRKQGYDYHLATRTKTGEWRIHD